VFAGGHRKPTEERTWEGTEKEKNLEGKEEEEEENGKEEKEQLFTQQNRSQNSELLFLFIELDPNPWDYLFFYQFIQYVNFE